MVSIFVNLFFFNFTLCMYICRITRFLEKPKPEDTSSRLACPVFYCLLRETLPLISSYTQDHLDRRERALGKFLVCLLVHKCTYFFLFSSSAFRKLGSKYSSRGGQPYLQLFKRSPPSCFISLICLLLHFPLSFSPG